MSSHYQELTPLLYFTLCDQFGRATNKIDHLGTNLFFYSYDANSRLLLRTSAAKGTTFYAYDAVGNLTNIDYPVSTDIRMAYDALNRVTNMVDSAGTCTYGYTTFGALAFEDCPWADDKVSYNYTSQLRTGLSLEQLNAPAWTNGYAYDGANRFQSVASPAGTFSYSFQGAGRLVKKLSLPNSSYITNTFDTVARLTGTFLKNSSHTVLNSHQYSYNLWNQRTNAVRTDGSFVGYGYDPSGQLVSALAKEPGGRTNRWNEQFRYTYDSAGNLSNRVANVLTNVFNVNSLNQLTSVICTNSSLTVGGNYSGAATNVTVADNGNSPVEASRYSDGTFARTNVTLLNGTNTFVAVAKDADSRADTNTAVSHLPSVASFAYDLNGNMLTNGTRFFEYNDENLLTCITEPNAWKSVFAYDGKLRRRVRKEFTWRNAAWAQTNEVRYVYDGNLVIQERNEFNIATKSYTRGLDLSGTMQGAGGIGGLLALITRRSSRPTSFITPM